jgi:hypothetical protein
LFDIRNADPSEHFIRFAVLSYLSKIPADAEVSLGYVGESTVIDYLASQGYSYTVSAYTIHYLAEKNCIRIYIATEGRSRSENRLKITPLGRFHLFTLVTIFQYLDAIIIDTPILDSFDFRMSNEFDIKQRLDRTERFISYLESKSAAIRDSTLTSEWSEIVKSALDNIREIRDRVNVP